jgi:hypothetical protein
MHYDLFQEFEGEPSYAHISKDGEYYLIDHPTYKPYRFVQISATELQDEEGVFGTLTLATIHTERKKDKPAQEYQVLWGEFAYHRVIFMKVD